MLSAPSRPAAGAARPAAGRPAVIPALELAAAAGFVLLPLVLGDYLLDFATRVAILCLFALSFDLVWGYAGILSFGQGFFFGAAGYGTALLARDGGVTSALALIPLALAIGSASALVVGGFVLLGRTRGSQFFATLGTMTVSYAGYRLANSWYYLGGQNGIPSLPELTLGSLVVETGPPFYALAVGLLAAAYGASRVLVRSQLGLALVGLREQDARVAFLGYRTGLLKTAVFTLAGGLAGVAGCLAGFHEGFVGPASRGIVLSTQVVFYVLLGGAGTLIGAVLGTVVTECVTFWLSDAYQQVWPIALGALLLALIMFSPSGLIGLLVPPAGRTGRFGPRPRRGAAR